MPFLFSPQSPITFTRYIRNKSNVGKVSVASPSTTKGAETSTPFSYGDLDTDFSQFANMADETMKNIVYDARDQYSPDLVPRDERFNDANLVATNVGQYKPNAWGLCDMHGNAAEWTLSEYNKTRRVVRGGSFFDARWPPHLHTGMERSRLRRSTASRNSKLPAAHSRQCGRRAS